MVRHGKVRQVEMILTTVGVSSSTTGILLKSFCKSTKSMKDTASAYTVRTSRQVELQSKALDDVTVDLIVMQTPSHHTAPNHIA